MSDHSSREMTIRMGNHSTEPGLQIILSPTLISDDHHGRRRSLHLGSRIHLSVTSMTKLKVGIVTSSMFALTLAACASNRPVIVSSTSSAATTKDSVTPQRRANTWVPKLGTGKWRYVIRDSSIVSISNDTVSRALPIESRTSYLVSVTDSVKGLILSARIDSSFANTHPTRNNADTSKAAELHVALSPEGKLPHLLETTSSRCSNASNSPISRIGEVRIVLPAGRVAVGDRWADTSSTTSCHGRIPLVHRAVSDYELLDLNSCAPGDGVKVRRIVTDTFTASTTESSNRLSASGSGTSSSILCLQRETAVVIRSNGQSRLDLVVTTSRGTFPFTQNTTTHIELQ